MKSGTQNNAEFIIPVEGSLSLLAQGYTALLKWRKIKKLHQEIISKKQKS
ncbi:MAG: hypothetical protein KA792_03895 [Bacteroidales bacterium]|nr:hypothetical protein [Bacteroidales bacterium]